MNTIVTVEILHNKIAYYRKTIDDSGHIINCDRFECSTKITEYDGKKMILITDRYGIIRSAPSKYVNKTRKGKSINSRLQMALAIQLFYIFCDIYGYDPEHIEFDATEKFVCFLTGEHLQSENKDHSIHPRKIQTVRNYLSMVREYLERAGFSTSGFKDQYNHFDLKPGNLNHNTAPTHFDPEQARLLAKEMKDNNDQQTLCIFMLAYKYGLRRGEILGLTINDVVKETDPSTGEVSHMLILRNRISDNEDQYAKTLLHPLIPENYKSKDFINSYYAIPIDESTYNKIIMIYNERKKYSPAEYRRIQEISKADDIKGKDNHYIFVIKGKKGWNRLSGITFNNHLNYYFQKFNLVFTNVSHAMRHSCAMFYAHYSDTPCDAEQLRHLLRHKSSKTTSLYFNITKQEERARQKKYVNEMDTLIPEFK